ncbi:hypothetical protein RMCBS344292_13218 [Rhizopus microsporus]|nr:hypothetical protein RMCBS344292_13218 [Rhizopus microsporus]
MYMFKRKQSKESDAPSKAELDNPLKKDPRCCDIAFPLRAGILAHCILVLIFHIISFLMDIWIFKADKQKSEPCEDCYTTILRIFRITIPILSVSFNVITFISDYNYLVGLIGSYFESITFISVYKYCRFINLVQFIVTSVEFSLETPKMFEAVKSDANIDSEIFKDERAQEFYINIFLCLGLFVPMIFNLTYKLFLTYKVVQYERLLERSQSSKKGA